MRVGPIGQAIFATYHAPETSAPQTALLICGPVGSRALPAHRLLRALADRVARSGRAALRFDYRCTGDSDGDCQDARMAEWLEDIQRADQRLRERSGCADIAWLGLGIGANLALAAADMVVTKPIGLFAWDPITQPEVVRRGVRRSLFDTDSAGGHTTGHLLFGPSSPQHELNGYPITDTLLTDLSSLVSSARRGTAINTTWLCSGAADSASPPRNASDNIVQIEDWLATQSSEEGAASLIVPGSILNAVETALRNFA
jgi:hypothetical protein